MGKKVKIDYFKFLNEIQFDKESNMYFFTYIDPYTDKTIHVENKVKSVIEKERTKVKKKLLRLKRTSKIKIETNLNVNVKKINKKNPKNEFDSNIIKNTLFTTEVKNKILELKISGEEKYKIRDEIINTYKLTYDNAEKYIHECYDDLAKDIDDDFVRLVIYSHGVSYDDLYKKLKELGASKLAMRALRLKEMLNGVGRDIFDVQVNNVFEDTTELITYGMNNLTNSEQEEFIAILSRISENNEQSERAKSITASKSH